MIEMIVTVAKAWLYPTPEILENWKLYILKIAESDNPQIAPHELHSPT